MVLLPFAERFKSGQTHSHGRTKSNSRTVRPAPLPTLTGRTARPFPFWETAEVGPPPSGETKLGRCFRRRPVTLLASSKSWPNSGILDSSLSSPVSLGSSSTRRRRQTGDHLSHAGVPRHSESDRCYGPGFWECFDRRRRFRTLRPDSGQRFRRGGSRSTPGIGNSAWRAPSANRSARRSSAPPALGTSAFGCPMEAK